MLKESLDTEVILFLAANPENTERIRFDVEARDIGDILRPLDRIKFETRFAVRQEDMLQAILDLKPVVVQFSGHGMGSSGIVIEGSGGRSSLVGVEVLSEFFKPFSEHIRCVVLNACDSDSHAEAIARHIDFVIGMDASISDDLAIAYSKVFYRFLASKSDVIEAHGAACNALEWGQQNRSEVVKLHSTRAGVEPFLFKGRHDSTAKAHSSMCAKSIPKCQQVPFVEKGYQQLRDEFCRYMLRELDSYDSDLNWNDSDYTNLAAEVEVDRRGARNPRVERDLVRAIHRDHTTRAFLLIGDPGSGKSVSLRRLCRQLHAKVEQTGVVPVYVNLRGWDGSPNPTDQELSQFILRTLKRTAGWSGKEFLDTWYESMLKNGRFFFLLDSFDEMPMVLDCDDTSAKIKDVSRTFDRFFHDLHQCRGVLASRRFRQPCGFRGRRMFIRSFKEPQIRKAMANWLKGQPLKPQDIIRRLFRDRPELVPVVRNPFLAGLTTQYLIHHHGELPPNQFAIYDAYINQLLKNHISVLRELGIEKARLLDVATRIARAMYEDSSTGLEVEIGRLRGWLEDEELDTTVQALNLIRLFRPSGGRSRRLAFTHRRFAEFFVVRSLIEEGQEIPFEAIPQDSRWRECLVVFCGVAPPERVQPIADFCWGVIEQKGVGHVPDPIVNDTREKIHGLRFLRDAFIARPEFLNKFRWDLELHILAWLRSPDFLLARLASESLGLVGSEACSEGIRTVFRGSGVWLKESALQACRNRSALEKSALRSIRRYVRTLPIRLFLADYKDLAFSLSLSESLRSQLWALRMDAIWLATLWFVVPWFWFSSVAQYDVSAFLQGSSIVLTLALVIELYFRYTQTKEHEESSLRSTPDVRHKLRLRSGPSYSRREFDTSLRVVLSAMAFLHLQNQLNQAHSRGLPALLTLTFLLISLPWDLPVIAAEVIRKAVEELRDIGLLVSLLLVLGFGTAFILVGIPILIESLPDLMFGALMALGGFLVFASEGYRLLKFTYKVLHDKIIMRRVRIPKVVTYPLIYRILDQLFTSRAKCQFLEGLWLKGVNVTGDRIPVPTRHSGDEHILEGMARLEYMWFGLDE